MRCGLLVALVLVTAACGAYRFPGASPAATGTVSGQVMAVPCAPVESIKQPCTGRVVPGLAIDFSNGDQTQTATTDSTGHYSIVLATGSWNVTMKSNMRIISGPPAVTVSAAATVIANFLLDSGIRVPVPQQ
ncbi:MAG: hypothetical protein ABI334_09865 [Candidatus Dormiibacterota bacterium]